MAIESTAQEGAAAPSTAPPARSRRRFRWLLLLLIAGGLFWALPWIVGSTALKKTVTYQVLPWLPPGATFEAPTLGWASPIHLSQIRILDHSGNVLLECAHVTSRKSLWEMAMSPMSPGSWDLESPHLTVRVGPNGTNLDPIIRDALSGPGSSELIDIEVSMSQGRIDVLDPEERPLAILNDLTATYGNAAGRGTIEAGGKFAEPQSAGGVTIQGTWSAGNDSIPEADIAATLSDWPVQIVAPIVTAHSTIEDLDGQFSAALSAKIAPDKDGSATVDGELKVSPITLQYRRADSKVVETLQPRDVVATVSGRWDREADRLELPRLGFESDLLAFSGAGTVDQPQGAAIVDLRGQVNQDLSPLIDLLSPQLRRHVNVTGLKMDQWAIRGAVRPELLSEPTEGVALAGNLTWDQAELFGLRAQPGSIAAAWEGPRVALFPREVTISGGQLANLPEIVLDPVAGVTVPRGPMLVNVGFTDEQCRGWLKFLSPLIANSTSVSGSFTLDLTKGGMPFGDFERADVEGTLDIHSGRLGPGPLAQRTLGFAGTLAEILGQNASWARKDVWLDLPAQQVPIRVYQGRVYHQGLGVRVGEMQIASTGSVGLDETLDVQLAIAVPEKWINKNPALASLRGQPVVIGVSGTLDQPRTDSRTLTELAKRVGVQAAGGLLQKLLKGD